MILENAFYLHYRAYIFQSNIRIIVTIVAYIQTYLWTDLNAPKPTTLLILSQQGYILYNYSLIIVYTNCHSKCKDA